MSRLRLYAIVAGPRRLRNWPRGLEGERLKLLRRGGLTLVTGAVAATLEPTQANLVAHDRLMRRLASTCDAMLPARFDVVATSASDLIRDIEGRAAVLIRALALVAGRVQMTLRLPGVKPRTRAIGASSRPRSGRSYLQERMVDVSSVSTLPRNTRERIAALVKAERVAATPASVVVYHLISRRDVRKYRALIRKPVAGPFPPYAFAPGIDHALWLDHDGQEAPPALRSPRSRAGRRSS